MDALVGEKAEVPLHHSSYLFSYGVFLVKAFAALKERKNRIERETKTQSRM
jgi:hypothetical protein